MHLIKSCPACGSKLRFPIDKGTIRVKCRCGMSFMADPDNPGLYRGAEFDLSYGVRGRSAALRSLDSAMEKLRPGRIIPSLINRALKIKYDLQNFRLLPSSRRHQIIIFSLILLFILLFSGYFICSQQSGVSPEDGIVI